jgi:hypothetical protein
LTRMRVNMERTSVIFIKIEIVRVINQIIEFYFLNNPLSDAKNATGLPVYPFGIMCASHFLLFLSEFLT